MSCFESCTLKARNVTKVGKGFPKVLRVVPPERDHQWQFQGALHPEYEAHHDLKHQKLLHPHPTLRTKDRSINKTPSKRVFC